MKRRIFVAIPVSERLQEEIFNWRQQYLQLPVRWLLGKNIHITLIPPWYCDEDEIKGVTERLKSVKFSEFDIEFNKVEFGPLEPPRGKPRLIWASGPTPPGLLELKQSLEKNLNIKPEKRNFQSHLTLARFRESDFSAFSIKHLEENVSWKEPVKRFVLMESHLSSSGADYQIIASFSPS